MVSGSSPSIVTPPGVILATCRGTRRFGAVLARNGGERHWRYVISPRVLVSDAARPARDRGRRQDCSCTSAPSTTTPRSGSMAGASARHEGGYTPFTFDITGCCRPVGGRARRSRRRRSRTISRSRVANRTGRSSRTRSGIRARPASGRPSGWRCVPRTPDRAAPVDAEPRALGDRPRSVDRRAPSARGFGCTSRLHSRRSRSSPTTPTRSCNGEVHRRIALSDPGIDDSRNELLWSPESPTLIEASLELWGERGELLDTVSSYTALRSVGDAGRSLRAQQPALSPTAGARPGLLARERPDRAGRRRAAARRRAGQGDGLQRRPQAPEDRRPALPLLGRSSSGCWSGRRCPAPTASRQQSVERVTREWTAAIERDCSHPCIIAWVPFNESWGVPNLPDNPAERHYVQALYHLTKTLDPTRPVIGNDGWESVATDIIGIHDYDRGSGAAGAPLSRRRSAAAAVQARTSRRAAAGARRRAALRSADCALGVRRHRAQHARRAPGATREPRTHDEFGGAVRAADADARSVGLLSGFCYTQFADTYQETNGLLDAKRRPKIPLASDSGRDARRAAISPTFPPQAPGSR